MGNIITIREIIDSSAEAGIRPCENLSQQASEHDLDTRLFVNGVSFTEGQYMATERPDSTGMRIEVPYYRLGPISYVSAALCEACGACTKTEKKNFQPDDKPVHRTYVLETIFKEV